ncbi:MAG: hypothetical protein JSR66_34275 [Proteobacteria bacterium]|nr:hypothetical protein [Pseudomonadota bacterium]
MSMNRRILILAGWLTGTVALVSSLLVTAQAQAAAPLMRPTFNVLHAFDEPSSGLVGPSVIPSGDGGYVGTLAIGGAFDAGVVFKLAPDGSQTTLYNFTGGADGGMPGGVIADAQGNLYGIAQQGGNPGCFSGSCGVIYEVTPDGRQTVLYAFASGTMGNGPTGQLTRDPGGNLYGATVLGGDTSCFNSNGCGVVFRLAPDGSYTVLHAFTGGADGAYPNGTLVRDRAGNLYGTTGDFAPLNAAACLTLPDVSCGAVFRIAPDGTYTRLHVFGGLAGGLTPTAGLVGDAAGNLYGTTRNGGVNPDNLCPAIPPWLGNRGGCGVVYKLAPGGAYSVLYAFKGGNDGIFPQGSLYRNPQGGGLYGTASTFSTNAKYCKRYQTCGLVFVVTPDGVKRTVYNFLGSDGLEPAIDTSLVKGYGAQLVGIATQRKNLTATVYSLQFEGGQ